MTENKELSESFCKDCKKLVGGHRHIPPHENLIATRIKEVNSMFGSVDEHYYKCRVCRNEWMLETGSYGQGWV
ncbi:MAG TPA: hypothetical protein PKY86_01380 [Niabella sp.]|nr:hypothetical protein [Niabella sp.]HQX72540.1 hypothetical protein [Chitinophagaceae bacterium]HQW16271.1 hypothetical protein [Niabella sp.]HQX21497.1 hypothetical protein [Niabella sp.]HRB36089.1 hypothetical protein [Niabella sp.]